MSWVSRNLAKLGAQDALRDSLQPHVEMLDDGIDHAILHAGGKHASNVITCKPGDANPELVNVFTVQGGIHVKEIFARCKTVTNSTTFSTVYFDVLDSNAGHDDITLAAGVDCSGILKRAIIAKAAVNTSAAVFTNSDKSTILDSGLSEVFAPFKIIPYNVDGETTIRFNFTGDVNTDLEMTVHLRYTPLSGATVTAV